MPEAQPARKGLDLECPFLSVNVIQQFQGLECRSVDEQGDYGVQDTDYRTVGGGMKRKSCTLPSPDGHRYLYCCNMKSAEQT